MLGFTQECRSRSNFLCRPPKSSRIRPIKRVDANPHCPLRHDLAWCPQRIAGWGRRKFSSSDVLCRSLPKGSKRTVLQQRFCITAKDRWLIGMRKIVSFVLLVACYLMVILLIKTSIDAQHQKSSEFKINYEYKVF